MVNLLELATPVDTRTRHLVVVYQMGKVGSTSIVNALNAHDGVRAVQTHFLGHAALSNILDLLLDPGQPDYFHAHRLGQFIANLDITRQIEAVRRGLTGQRVTVLSLVRAPVDWFRSCLVQDSEGYMPVFARYGAHLALGASEEDGLIRRVLPEMLDRLAEALESAGGVDACLATPNRFAPHFKDLPPAIGADLRSMLSVFLRPFSWLDDHLLTCFDLSWAQFDGSPLSTTCDWGEVHLVRFEDMDTLPALLAERGLPRITLRRDNASGIKPHAGAIKSAFGTGPAERLRALAGASRFAARFGYDG